MTTKLISTTALSKNHELTSKALFDIFVNLGWLERVDNEWALTVTGLSQGSSYRTSKQYGKYIVWPEDINFEIPDAEPLITATVLGKGFEVSAQKLNFILSEIGWAKKGDLGKGWIATDHGLNIGAIQAEDAKSGVPYIRWPINIAKNKTLVSTIADFKGNPIEEKADKVNLEISEFRNEFPAKHRAIDGHFTRSKAEILIDNWLYMFEIVHAYERKLPIEEDVYSDFYIPTGKVYIEYWSNEKNTKYLHHKRIKQGIYKKYGFNLIELEDKDVQNLDDILPKILLKFGVQTY
ncbi:MAG: hypothetical protein L3J51_10360 [Cocleimonas sp.]|nr:hypothetical protein [Cocleimonas sp.]